MYRLAVYSPPEAFLPVPGRSGWRSVREAPLPRGPVERADHCVRSSLIVGRGRAARRAVFADSCASSSMLQPDAELIPGDHLTPARWGLILAAPSLRAQVDGPKLLRTISSSLLPSAV